MIIEKLLKITIKTTRESSPCGNRYKIFPYFRPTNTNVVLTQSLITKLVV